MINEQKSTPTFFKKGNSVCIDIDCFLKAPMSEAINLGSSVKWIDRDICVTISEL